MVCDVYSMHVAFHAPGTLPSGQLGIGSTTSPVKTPGADAELPAGAAATVVSCGSLFTCAVASSDVYCWGDNTYGQVCTVPMCVCLACFVALICPSPVPPQIGVGTTTTQYTTPQLVPGLSAIASVSAGYFHACALAINASVYCWGQGTSYVLMYCQLLLPFLILYHCLIAAGNSDMVQRPL